MITRVRLKNYGLYEDFEVHFPPGVSVIIGPNGSGKSTILEGIRFALSGEGPPREQRIRQNAPSEEASSVEIDLEVGAELWTLTRHLRSSKRVLRMPTGTLTADKEIRERLERVFERSIQTVLEHSFVPQWKMFEFLTATDTERNAIFARLFDTRVLAKLGDTVAEHVRMLYDPPLILEKQERDKEIAAREAERDALGEPTEEEQRILQNGFDLRQTEEYKRLEASRDAKAKAEAWADLLKQQVDTDRLLEEAGERLSTLGSNLSDLDRTQLEGRLAKIRKELKERDALERLISTRDALQTQQRALCHQLNTLVRPVPPQEPEAFQTLDNRQLESHLREALGELTSLATFLKTCDSGKPACPTCGTPTENLLPLRPQKQDRFDYLTDSIKTLREIKAVRDAYNQADCVYENTRIPLVGRLDEVESELNQIQLLLDGEAPRLLSDQGNALLTEQQVLLTTLASLGADTREYERLGKEYAKLRTRKQQLNEKQATFCFDESAILSPQQERALEEALRSRQQRAGAIQQQEAARRLLDTLLAGLRAKQDELIKRLVKAEQRAELRTEFEELRALFLSDALPARVSEQALRQIVKEINRFFAACELDFVAELGENQRFMVRFFDGRCHDARWLSGGQLTVYALACRVAVQKLCASDTGFFILDEPTAGLDLDNLKSIRVAVERLANQSGGRPFRVILVTHEMQLAPLFEHVTVLAHNGTRLTVCESEIGTDEKTGPDW